jgi:hypothetical protein
LHLVNVYLAASFVALSGSGWLRWYILSESGL